MNQKAAIAGGATAFSNKCAKCGRPNPANKELCSNCGSPLSIPLIVANDNPGLQEASSEFGRWKIGLACILTGVLALALGLFLFHTNETPQESAEAITVPSAEQPATSQAEPSAPEAPAENGPQSQEAARQVLSELKGFEGIAERKMEYEEYNERLNNLKAEVDKALPGFVRHNPKDETFRQEIAAAIRDYTAAGNWWKTTITNSTVFSETDRNDKLQTHWTSAKTHIDTADNILIR